MCVLLDGSPISLGLDFPTNISIFVNDLNEVQKYQKKLIEVLPPGSLVRTWIDSNENLFSVIQLEKLGLGIILTLIILIASLNIISSLIMLVVEKQKDISILKALGATSNSLKKIFLIQGSVIGLVGTIIGVFLGVLFCWMIQNYEIIEIPRGVYPTNHIPVYLKIWQVVLITVVSSIICFFVTLIPSHKAAKLNPIEGIKYE